MRKTSLNSKPIAIPLWKKIFDKVFSFSILLMLFPFFLIIAALIKLTSKGPVFYKQKRIGYKGKYFYLYKFRTMVINADEVLESVLRENPKMREEFLTLNKLTHDPRITKIGKILRKTSLDELPQFINVLKGDMSIIGPRPITDRDIYIYLTNLDYITKLPPGLTGLWQVSGRNDLPIEERVKLDRYYVDHLSFPLDLKILFKTLFVIVKGTGAY